MDFSNIMYMVCPVIDSTKSHEETTIVKMDCDTLCCAEIFWTKRKIIHIAVVENKKIENGTLLSSIDESEDFDNYPVKLDSNDLMPIRSKSRA
jgi:hypothetical protein